MTDDLDAIARELQLERDAEYSEQRWLQLAPPRFQTARLLEPRERMETGWAEIAKWSDEPAGRNLIITGPVGTGKTHAAFAAVRPHVRRGIDVLAFPTVELLDKLRPGNDDAHLLERCMACHFLVLDDLGVERPTDWVAERLYAIVNRRWMSERPTIVTTNAASSDDLAAHVGERMRSRLIGSGAVVVRLGGGDKRRARGDG